MKHMEELLETANQLCARLDAAIENEYAFAVKVRSEFERMAWESYRMMNDLKQIQEYL